MVSIERIKIKITCLFPSYKLKKNYITVIPSYNDKTNYIGKAPSKPINLESKFK